MINHQNKHELNPCPFCGSNDLDVTQWIECNGCGAFGPTPSDDGDLSAWNRLKGVVIELPEQNEAYYGAIAADDGLGEQVMNADAVRTALTDAGVTFE